MTWFVVNAREAPWMHAEGRNAFVHFEHEQQFEQIGININVMQPGQPMARYHWEADQEDFLVLEGEAIAIVEGEERRLRAWDFLHCPAGTAHVIVGAGTGRCVVVAIGARDKSVTEDWGGYVADPTAAKHGAAPARDTTDPAEAYAGLKAHKPVPYDPSWLD